MAGPASTSRRLGAPDAKNRTVLLDAAESLMRAEGYAAVTSRRVADKAGLTKSLVAATKLPDAVIQRQLERTELTHSVIGKPQADSIIAAGVALQEAGVLESNIDIKAVTASLIEPKYLTAGATQ